MEKDATHKWAIVAIAVILFLCTSAVSAFSKQTSMYFIVWLMVGWYGYKGNLEAIRTTIKFSICANLGLMTFIYLFVGNNEYDTVRNLKNLMAIGLAIMLVPSAILFFYCSQEINEEKISKKSDEIKQSKNENKVFETETKNQKTSQSLNEEEINEIYSEVFQELENGNIDKGLWARCFAEENGEENKVKAQYIKIKSSKIIEEKLVQKKTIENNAHAIKKLEEQEIEKQVANSPAKKRQEAINVWITLILFILFMMVVSVITS